ncbi:hypothetical protein PHSY_004713 [Pseudozyma hubeiensis SY62]|uniref:Uncharacterized protein n=1 Tax=Pseudozyma hubeiensis (strain SY62) TaxID=1305764 RepID=R9P6U6_PSEHS|nr:hypothetical protein PHSY_004713 [Pseudozyma hubeiensis SY62]GAC97128.1 hypothetical protein PHSY_004713 [Pseudozyma hubeiensis SY62]
MTPLNSIFERHEKNIIRSETIATESESETVQSVHANVLITSEEAFPNSAMTQDNRERPMTLASRKDDKCQYLWFQKFGNGMWRFCIKIKALYSLRLDLIRKPG